MDPRESRLAALGLGAYEARALLSLLDLGLATPRDVAAAAAMPRTRAYDALGALEERGLVERRAISPLRFAAIGVGPLIDARVGDLRRRIAEAETLLRGSASGAAGRASVRPGTGLELFEGAAAVEAILEEAVRTRDPVALAADPGSARWVRGEDGRVLPPGSRWLALGGDGAGPPAPLEAGIEFRVAAPSLRLSTLIAASLVVFFAGAPGRPLALASPEPALVAGALAEFNESWSEASRPALAPALRDPETHFTDFVDSARQEALVALAPGSEFQPRPARGRSLCVFAEAPVPPGLARALARAGAVPVATADPPRHTFAVVDRARCAVVAGGTVLHVDDAEAAAAAAEALAARAEPRGWPPRGR